MRGEEEGGWAWAEHERRQHGSCGWCAVTMSDDDAGSCSTTGRGGVTLIVC